MTAPQLVKSDSAPRMCGATASTGSPCRMVATSAPEHPPRCIWHDEHRRDEADAMRVLSQAARQKKVITMDDEEPALQESEDLELTAGALAVYQGWAVRQCAGGGLSPERLRSITQGLTSLRGMLMAKELARQVRQANAEIKRLKKELASKTGTHGADWE